MKTVARFARALVIAALYYCGQRQCLRRAWGFIPALLSLLRRPAPEPVIRDRLTRCRKCSIYNSRLETCGTPFVESVDDEPMGCFCYMPVKARLPEATCWLADNTNGEMGWPDYLNDIANTETTPKQCTPK